MPYIIYGGLYKEGMPPKLTAVEFIKRRISRTRPLCLFITLIVVFISWTVSLRVISNPTADFSYIFKASKLDLLWIIKTMSFMNFDRPPILGIGWTLQFEFLFYFLLIGLLLIKVKNANSLEIYSIFSLVVLCVANSLTHSNNNLLVIHSSLIYIKFIFGMYLYCLYSGGGILPRWLAWIGLVFFFPLFVFTNSGVFTYTKYSRVLTWGIPAFILVWSALSLEGYIHHKRIFLLLGDSSYILYLPYGASAPIFLFIWTRFGFEHSIGIAPYIIIYCIFCQSVGIVLYKPIEKPMNNWIKLKSYGNK